MLDPSSPLSRAYFAIRSAFRDVAEVMSSPDDSIEVVYQDDKRLVLSANGYDITADKRTRTVRSGDKVLARFDAIKTIDITSIQHDNGQGATWTVSLYLGWFSRVRIGRTEHQVDASIAAARLSTITGAKVLA